MQKVTKGHEPRAALGYFEAISAIPRGSGNEKGIADYLEAFGKARGFYVYRDAMHNVFIRKPASPGSEGKPAVLLQGHTDMVCEKNNDVQHDFLNDPIQLQVVGDILRADGTTLGADNGMAVAYMLAMLADDTLQHPTLECLFTVQEETGLYGAQAFDCKQITARNMINIDAGPEGNAIVSCAGGMRIDMEKKLAQQPFAGQALTLTLKGLMGGHSGAEIHQYRGNANRLMGRILAHIDGVHLLDMAGGNKENAIPRECVANIAVPDAAKAQGQIEAMAAVILRELPGEDQGFEVLIEQAPARESMATADDTHSVIAMLCLVPNGVIAMSRQMEGLVECSSNLGIVKTQGDVVQLALSPRSCTESLQDDTELRMQLLAQALGFTCTTRSRYPGWAYEKDSPLRTLLCEVYSELTGKDMQIAAVHGGLECGLIKSNVPALDIVAIGPDNKNAHTPDEQLNMKSAQRVWELLCAMVERLA